MFDFGYRPLLQAQAQLLEIPPGPERFQAYLKLMTGDDGDLTAPLPLFNPFSKPHVGEVLERALASGYEAVAEAAVAEAVERLGGTPSGAAEAEPPPAVLSLVVGDDLHGGWTDRAAVEYGLRRDLGPLLARRMLAVALWTSEPLAADEVRTATLEACYRAAHFLTRGQATTLDELLDQEGRAARFAGRGPGELTTRQAKAIGQALAPVLKSEHFGQGVPALFGDEAATTLGLPTLGIPPRGGLAYACERAWWDATTPEEHVVQHREPRPI